MYACIYVRVVCHIHHTQGLTKSPYLVKQPCAEQYLKEIV